MRFALLALLAGLVACEPPLDLVGGGDEPGDEGPFDTPDDDVVVEPDPEPLPDSDGDTYADADELSEGTDPHDPDSRIYTGYWPYQRDKDALPEGSFADVAAPGGRAPRLRGVDQWGDEVDLYDLAGHGKPVVIELSAVWCDWCGDLAAWLEGEPSRYDELFPEHADLAARVRDGEVLWVTVLDEGPTMAPITDADVRAWYDAFPNPRVPVLADEAQRLNPHFQPPGLPWVALADDQLEYRVVGGPAEVFDALDP